MAELINIEYYTEAMEQEQVGGPWYSVVQSGKALPWNLLLYWSDVFSWNFRHILFRQKVLSVWFQQSIGRQQSHENAVCRRNLSIPSQSSAITLR